MNWFALTDIAKAQRKF